MPTPFVRLALSPFSLIEMEKQKEKDCHQKLVAMPLDFKLY